MKKLFIIFITAIVFVACDSSEMSKCEKAEKKADQLLEVFTKAKSLADLACSFVSPSKIQDRKINIAEACDKTTNAMKIAEDKLEEAKISVIELCNIIH
jgi:hypothetical protein